MMYPFMTLNDGTEIVHSEMKKDGSVKVYIETPDNQYAFKHATCWLPSYKWEDIYQYSDSDIKKFDDILRSTAHLIMRIIEARSEEVVSKWNDYFGEIRYFC